MDIPLPTVTALRASPSDNLKFDQRTYVTAPTIQQLQTLFSRSQSVSYRRADKTMPHMANRVSLIGALPPEQYNSRYSPLLRVDYAVAHDFAAQLRVPILPDHYWQVARLLNRLSIFLESVSSGEERFFREPARAAGLRAQIRLWHAPKIKRAVVDLLNAGQWEDSPPPHSPQHALNQYMAQLHLGRQNHLPRSSAAYRRARTFGPTGPVQRAALENPLVQHARALPPAERDAYLAANPGTAWLYAQAYPADAPPPSPPVPVTPAALPAP